MTHEIMVTLIMFPCANYFVSALGEYHRRYPDRRLRIRPSSVMYAWVVSMMPLVSCFVSSFESTLSHP